MGALFYTTPPPAGPGFKAPWAEGSGDIGSLADRALAWLKLAQKYDNPESGLVLTCPNLR